MKDINDFLYEYNNTSDLKFSNLQYRKGAHITCSFGLSEGYRIVNNKMIFDTTRIHSGVDRGSANKSGTNVVIAPFDFQRAEYIDYGTNHVYGAVLRLFQEEYNFEMRIIHLQPEELTAEFQLLLSQNKFIKRNTIIGKAGNYGSASSGRHTHTEIISLEKSCKTLDDLLELKFREDAFSPYTNQHIIDFYYKQDYWKDERSIDKILNDFKQQRIKRKIYKNMINDFSYHYSDWYSGWKYRTRYSSELLWNGL